MKLLASWWTAASIAIISPSLSLAASLTEAQASGKHYSCEYDTPSFFGERTYLRARVIGRDYIVEFSEKEEHPHDGIGMYRIGKWGYYWIDDGEQVHASKLDLEKVDALHQELFERPYIFSTLLIDAPDDSAVCEPTAPFEVEPAKHDYKNTTADKINEIRGWYDKQIAILDGLTFKKLAPRPHPKEFEKAKGYAGAGGYTLDYFTTWERGGTMLRLRFFARATAEERDLCWARSHCAQVATTPEGKEIFALRRSMGPHREPKVGHEYSVDIEGTVVVITWTDWSHESGTSVRSYHEFAPNQLGYLVDSLEGISSVELLRFPDMSVLEH